MAKDKSALSAEESTALAEAQEAAAHAAAEEAAAHAATEAAAAHAAEAAAAEATAAVIVPEFKFEIVKRVTLALFKMVPGTEYYFRFDSPIALGKDIAATAGSKKKEPAYLAQVTDRRTGEVGQIILGTVLRKEMEEAYPDATYIGKSFMIKPRKIAGKDYNGYDIALINVL